MDPTTIAALAAWLVKQLVDLVGHEEASKVLTQEAINRANAAADAVEAARGLT